MLPDLSTEWQMREKFLVVFLVTVLGCQTQAGDADLVILNARVYSLTWGQPAPDGTPAPDAPHDANGWHPDAEAVAIKDSRIVFVGSSEAEQRFHRGKHTHDRSIWRNGAARFGRFTYARP